MNSTLKKKEKKRGRITVDIKAGWHLFFFFQVTCAKRFDNCLTFPKLAAAANKSRKKEAVLSKPNKSRRLCRIVGLFPREMRRSCNSE